MSRPPIALVITGDGVGGAEKRLSEIWLHLAPHMPNLRMIVRASTLPQLLSRPDLAGLGGVRDRITTVEARGSSYPAIVRAFGRELWRLPRGSVVHHILQAPPLVHRLHGHKMLVSWVSTFFPEPFDSQPSFNHWLVSSLSLRAASLIDVLNPEIMQDFATRPELLRKARLTVGGTFVDGATFRPGAKRDEILFLGRIERFKNALAFVRSIPVIARRLAAIGKATRIRLYGRPGDQGEEVRRLLGRPDFRAIDIQWSETDNPAQVLATAKVFVSLQSPSNYPSKALAEAMAAGCVPVISDSGESRRMASPAVARFVPENFTGEELAEAVAEILALDEDAFAKRSAAARSEALERFRIEPQADYFAGLYEELAGR